MELFAIVILLLCVMGLLFHHHNAQINALKDRVEKLQTMVKVDNDNMVALVNELSKVKSDTLALKAGQTWGKK